MKTAMRHPWILAPKFRALIHAKSLTYSEVSRRASIPYQSIAAIIRGRQPNPETLAKLLEAIGATEQELLDAVPSDNDASPPGRRWPKTDA